MSNKMFLLIKWIKTMSQIEKSMARYRQNDYQINYLLLNSH